VDNKRRENRMGNEEWAIQRHRQHWAHTQDIGRRQTKHKNTTHYRNIKILATRIPPQNGDE